MTDTKRKEKAANEAANMNTVESIVADIDPVDKAVNGFSLREELKNLDLVSVTLQKRTLAKKYSLTAKDIVDCWKDIKTQNSEEADDIKKTPEKILIESLSSKDPSEPWPEEVEIGELIKETANTLKVFIVFKNDAQAYACALWVIASWFVDYISFSPYLIISAPMKQCGKSQLLRCLSNLSRRPLLSGSLSASVLFRVIEMARPTVFIDEVDTFLKNDPELIGIINAGIEKDGAKVYRNEKTAAGAFIPTPFDCFSFKALSGISAKNISETITDRSIVIELQRKDKAEEKKKLREVPADYWTDLKRKILRAVMQYGEAVEKSTPAIPKNLSDRDGDKWASLFAIADLAKDQRTGAYFRQVAKELRFKDEGAISASYELLSDIRDILEKDYSGKAEARIPTGDLITKLIEDENLTWGTWNRGRPLSPKQLANRLKEFGIKPKKWKEYGQDFRGYVVLDFQDAFNRYLEEKEGEEASKTLSS